jgi:hypothetical protein
LVKLDVAAVQASADRLLAAEAAASANIDSSSELSPSVTPRPPVSREKPEPGKIFHATADHPNATPPRPQQMRRYHGSVSVNPRQVATEVQKIADAVVQHLAATYGTKVTITLEIHAENENGFPEKVVQNVSENSRTLKFDNTGFDET